MWVLQGVLLGLFLAGTLLLVWRHDRALVPMMVAGVALLRGAKDVITAAHPYAVPGELLAMALVLAVALGWTWVLLCRQTAEAVTGV